MNASDTGILTTFCGGVCYDSGGFDFAGVVSVSGAGFTADVPDAVCP